MVLADTQSKCIICLLTSQTQPHTIRRKIKSQKTRFQICHVCFFAGVFRWWKRTWMFFHRVFWLFCFRFFVFSYFYIIYFFFKEKGQRATQKWSDKYGCNIRSIRRGSHSVYLARASLHFTLWSQRPRQIFDRFGKRATKKNKNIESLHSQKTLANALHSKSSELTLKLNIKTASSATLRITDPFRSHFDYLVLSVVVVML